MVAIPEVSDPTMMAVDAMMEQKSQDELPRPYLGMSIVGDDCERKLWLAFRWVGREAFKANTLKKFDDGHLTEDLIIKRLESVPFLEIHHTDPSTGGQYGFSDLGGHFKGHMDFVVRGLIQAPKTWHVGDVKATEKVSEIKRAKTKFGEKEALEQWHPVYWAQAQCYMGFGGLTRHWIVCVSPGGRDPVVTIRTDYDEAAFLRLRAKARRVVFSARPPLGISKDPTFYKCKWCAFHAHCHEAAWPDASNCRTCLHSTPEEDGTWSCARFAKTLSVDEQRQGCPAHLYIPDLIPAEQVDAGPDWVSYRFADGTEWRDGA